VTGIAIGDPARLIVPCDAIVIAPIPQGRVAAAPVAAAVRAARAPAHLDAHDARRRLAAGLLGLAALGLGGVAAVRFRASRSELEASEPTILDHGPDDLTAGPRLALVRLPNEPGR